MRDFVQANPGARQLLRNLGAVVAERGPATAASKPRERRRRNRGHDGTMDSPVSQPEQFENHDIHRGTSPTPTPETFTPAETAPPASTTSPPVPQQTTKAGIRDASTNPNVMHTGKRKAKGQADASSSERHDQPESPAPIHCRGPSRQGRR